MRAKEHLEINKSRIVCYDIVKYAVDALSRLRKNKTKTEEYFNKYLFADARQLAQPVGFVLREGEVDNSIANTVRIQIMSTICYDDSFIYAYNIISLNKNDYYEFMPLKFIKVKEVNCDTQLNIEKVCTLYKEDYPKDHLGDFLVDDMNKEYAQRKNCIENGGLDWWKDIFNKAYEQFDIIRVQLTNGFDELNFISKICVDDKKKEREVIELLSYMFSYYNYDLDEMQMKRYRILSGSLKTIYNKNQQDLNLVAEPVFSINSSEGEKSYEQEITRLRRENEQLRLQIEKDDSEMTCSQQVMTFIYLLNHIGININNTKKSIIARFINRIIGKSEANIRKRLDFNYDDLNVKHNLRIVAEAFREISPGTADQILRDIEG